MEQTDAAAHRLAAVVESSDDAILSEDLDGCIDSWNRSAAELFGYSAGEVIGQSIDIIIPDSERPAARRLSEQARRGENVGHFQGYRRKRNGQLVPMSLAMWPIRDTGGRIIGVSTIARDI